MLAGLVLTWLLEAKWKEKWEMIKTQPVFKAMLIYFIFAVLSLLWTENIPSGLHYIKQYYIFFLLPIFYTSIDRSYTPKLLSVFLVAMIISEIVSYLIYFDLIPFKLNPTWSPSDPSPFMMHSIYSIFLVFSIFLMLTRLAYENRTQLQSTIYVLFIITMCLNLFFNSGRAGQFSFFLILIIFIYLHYRLHWIKTVTLGLFLSIIIFSIAFFISPNFQNRSVETYDSLSYTINNKEANSSDSAGQRFMMWQVASKIIEKNPIFVVGIGDERDSYSRTLVSDFLTFPSFLSGFTDLHNTYLKIFVSTGIIGLTLFLYVFFTFYTQLDSSKESKILGASIIALILQYMLIGNLPAAHLTILFILIISITLKHQNSLVFTNTSVK